MRKEQLAQSLIKDSNSGEYRVPISTLYRGSIERSLTRLDRRTSVFLRRLNSGRLAPAMVGFSALGAPQVFPCTATLIAAWLWWINERRAAIIVIGAAVATRGLTSLLKLFFRRARPGVSALRDSFPSGHAIAAIAVYGTAADAVAGLHPSAQPLLMVGAATVALMVGVARIARGHHWPTDVLAGFAVGTLILALGVLGLSHP